MPWRYRKSFKSTSSRGSVARPRREFVSMEELNGAVSRDECDRDRLEWAEDAHFERALSKFKRGRGMPVRHGRSAARGGRGEDAEAEVSSAPKRTRRGQPLT